MKVIDLLNKIANGEEIPKKIKVNRYIYTYAPYIDYINEDNNYLMDIIELNQNDLNDEVEIIEDKPFNERVEEIYNRHIDYIYGKEDKKIPEKIKILNCDNYVKKGNYETILTMQEIALDIQTLRHKINEIIDYLEEKE